MSKVQSLKRDGKVQNPEPFETFGGLPRSVRKGCAFPQHLICIEAEPQRHSLTL